MTDYSELRRLAEAAPEGPWFGPEYAPGTSYVFDVDLGTLLAYEGIDSEKDACLRYVAAASPVAVLALIAEIGRYRQHGCDTCDGSGHLHRIDGEYYGACTSCGAYELEQARRERDQLKDENEHFRYLLGECRLMSFVVNSGHSGVLRGQIDAAMGKGEKSGG